MTNAAFVSLLGSTKCLVNNCICFCLHSLQAKCSQKAKEGCLLRRAVLELHTVNSLFAAYGSH